jgi:hypothetical protein
VLIFRKEQLYQATMDLLYFTFGSSFSFELSGTKGSDRGTSYLTPNGRSSSEQLSLNTLLFGGYK